MNEPEYVKSSRYWWAFGIACFFVVLLIIAIGFIIKQRRRTIRQQHQLQALYNQLMGVEDSSLRDYLIQPVDSKHPLHERLEQMPYDRKYEISKDRLSFHQVIYVLLPVAHK